MSVVEPRAPLATARLFEYCVALIDIQGVSVTPAGTPVPSLNTLGYYGWELLHVVLTGNLQQGLGFFRRDLITTPPPVLALTALEPASAVLGSPSFTLRVLGTGFTPDSVIIWNGADEVTTYVTATELSTGVNMTYAEIAMEIPVEVRNGEEISNSLSFTFLAA